MVRRWGKAMGEDTGHGGQAALVTATQGTGADTCAMEAWFFALSSPNSRYLPCRGPSTSDGVNDDGLRGSSLKPYFCSHHAHSHTTTQSARRWQLHFTHLVRIQQYRHRALRVRC